MSFLNKASLVTLNALNWTERKTRDAADRQLQRQLARHQNNSTAVEVLGEDLYTPRYMSRRAVHFAEAEPDFQ
jgi:hypothetical protein